MSINNMERVSLFFDFPSYAPFSFAFDKTFEGIIRQGQWALRVTKEDDIIDVVLALDGTKVFQQMIHI